MQGQRDLAFSSILFMSCNVRDPGEGPFIWSPSMSYSGFGLSHTDLSFFSYSLNPKTKPSDFGVHRVYSVFFCRVVLARAMIVTYGSCLGATLLVAMCLLMRM